MCFVCFKLMVAKCASVLHMSFLKKATYSRIYYWDYNYILCQINLIKVRKCQIRKKSNSTKKWQMTSNNFSQGL